MGTFWKWPNLILSIFHPWPGISLFSKEPSFPFWWKMILRIWALGVIIPVELALVSKAFQWTELKNHFLKIKCIMGSFHFRCKNTFFFTSLMSYLYLLSCLLKIPVPCNINIISHSLLHTQDSEWYSHSQHQCDYWKWFKLFYFLFLSFLDPTRDGCVLKSLPQAFSCVVRPPTDTVPYSCISLCFWVLRNCLSNLNLSF